MTARRLPYYFLVEAPPLSGIINITACRNFFESIISTMRADPFALESVHLSVIKFTGGAKNSTPLVSLCSFELSIDGFEPGFGLECGLTELVSAIRSDLVPSNGGVRGDWRPNVVLWLTSEPTVNFEKGLRELESIRVGSCFAVVAGSVSMSTTNRLKDAGFIVVSAATGEDPFFRWREDVWKSQFDWIEADIDDSEDSFF